MRCFFPVLPVTAGPIDLPFLLPYISVNVTELLVSLKHICYRAEKNSEKILCSSTLAVEASTAPVEICPWVVFGVLHRMLGGFKCREVGPVFCPQEIFDTLNLDSFILSFAVRWELMPVNLPAPNWAPARALALA